MMWFIALAALAAGDAPNSFDDFFADFAKKRDGVNVLEARFTQQNQTSEETVDSKGALLYVRPRRIIFRYEPPESSPTYLIDDRRAYEYEPDIKQLQIYDLQDNSQTEVFFLGFDDNTQALREAYDVEIFEIKDAAEGKHGILIRPKKKANSEEPRNFRQVSLYLRDLDYLPYRIHIVHDDDSEVDIRVSEFNVNGRMDPTRTQVTLPPGTKIIDNDEMKGTVGPEGKAVPPGMALPDPAALPKKQETPAK